MARPTYIKGINVVRKKQKALPFGKTHVYKRYQVPIKNRTKIMRNEAQEFSELEL